MNDGTHSYTYDAEDRIVKVDGGGTATYVYDAGGRRIRKTTLAGIFDYVPSQSLCAKYVLPSLA
jgi:YD repeat-containing protein